MYMVGLNSDMGHSDPVLSTVYLLNFLKSPTKSDQIFLLLDKIPSNMWKYKVEIAELTYLAHPSHLSDFWNYDGKKEYTYLTLHVIDRRKIIGKAYIQYIERSPRGRKCQIQRLETYLTSKNPHIRKYAKELILA